MTYMQLDEGRREQGDTGGAARADDGDDGGGSLGEQSRAAWLFYSGYKKLIRSREEEIFSRQDVLPLAHTAWPLKATQLDAATQRQLPEILASFATILPKMSSQRRILYVQGFHPATRARDLAYEFEKCAFPSDFPDSRSSRRSAHNAFVGMVD